MTGWSRGGALLASALCACLSVPPLPEPDDAAPAGDGGSLDCDEQFGDLLEYLACPSEGETCTFYSECPLDCTCDEICTQRGATCVSTYNTAGGSPTCSPSSIDEGCQADHEGLICVCMPPPA